MRLSSRPRRALPRRRDLLVAAAVGSIAALAPAAASGSTLKISVPADPLESSSVQIDVSATLDVASYIEVKLRPAGAACADSAGQDPGELILDRSAIDPQFAVAAFHAFDAAGQYLICGWARDTTQANSPVVASASATINVRVPKLSLAVTVAPAVAVDDLFTIKTVASAEVERLAYMGIVRDLGTGCPASYSALQKASGAVPVLPQAGLSVIGGPTTSSDQISLPRKGNYLACAYFHHGAVASTPQATAKAAFVVGAACVVPTLKGKTLAQTKKLLAKAHCRLGKAKKAKSKTVAKNRVVRTGKKAGTRLAPNTAIGVVVSSGA